MKQFNDYLKNVKERWDPSMSNDSSAPWNQTYFAEENEDILQELETKLGYTKDQIDVLVNSDNMEKWETEVEDKYADLYTKTFEKGYDREEGVPIYSDIYNTILKQVTDLSHKNMKDSGWKFKSELRKATGKYIVEHFAEEFRSIYDKYIVAQTTTESLDQTYSDAEDLAAILIDTFQISDIHKESEIMNIIMSNPGNNYKQKIDEISSKFNFDRALVEEAFKDFGCDINESGELVPIQAGEVIKLQKPAADTYTNKVMNNDNVEIADCTVCGATSVIVGEHICKTVLDTNDQVPSEFNMVENRFESVRTKYGVNENKMITKIDWFKNIISK